MSEHACWKKKEKSLCWQACGWSESFCLQRQAQHAKLFKLLMETEVKTMEKCVEKIINDKYLFWPGWHISQRFLSIIICRGQKQDKIKWLKFILFTSCMFYNRGITLKLPHDMIRFAFIRKQFHIWWYHLILYDTILILKSVIRCLAIPMYLLQYNMIPFRCIGQQFHIWQYHWNLLPQNMMWLQLIRLQIY